MTASAEDTTFAEPADLPRPPGFFRREMRSHPRAVDRTIAVAYLALAAVLSVLALYTYNAKTGAFDYVVPTYLLFPRVLLLVLMAAVATASLLWRRRFPLICLVATVAVSLLASDDMVPAVANTFAISVLLYSVPVYRSIRAGWAGYAITVATSLLPAPTALDAVLVNDAPVTSLWAVFITSALLMLVPLTLGINAGNRRRYLDAIIDRAHQLVRERDQLARLAVAEERSRIAREMHDIVAHSLSVMITLAEGAARVAQTQPAEATKAMVQSAETGRTALGEMRRMIGVLRDPEGTELTLAPVPGIDQLPELAEGFRTAGLVVNLTLRGSAADGLAAQSQELAVYRIVQEALTNTLRHAGPGAKAAVTITWTPRAIDVQVTDDGGVPGTARTISQVGSGQGLAGLRERTRVSGGTLGFGPMDPGGWRVTASLPRSEPENPGEVSE